MKHLLLYLGCNLRVFRHVPLVTHAEACWERVLWVKNNLLVTGDPAAALNSR